MAERKKAMISHGIASQNRKARHDYKIGETLEAGLVLVGPEVKSLRAGRATLSEAWAGERDGELWLFNCTIPEWQAGSVVARFEPRRPRKLLLHRKQVRELIGSITREGVTLVPLDIHFNDKGRAKVLLGLAEGKKQHDKRQAAAARDWARDKARLMRLKG
jgi:SsrA-binding protein